MLKATLLHRVSAGVYKLSYVNRDVEVTRTAKGWVAKAAWNPNLVVGPFKQKVRARNAAADMIEKRIEQELTGTVNPAGLSVAAAETPKPKEKRGRGRPRKNTKH